MTQKHFHKEQEARKKDILTVEEIKKLPENATFSGFKGILGKVQRRRGKTSGNTFFVGHLTDHTGRIRATFFRDDVLELRGRHLKILCNFEGRGLRKNLYNNSSEMTVFPEAKIISLNPDGIEDQAQKGVQRQAAEYHDPKNSENLTQAIGISAIAAARNISALLNNSSMPDPVQWLYSGNFPQMVDRLMNVYVDAIRKQEAVQNRT